jgi:hypothetical protein
MKPEPQSSQHQWLQRLIGEWTFDAGENHKGSEVVRPLGDLWIVAEGEGTMPGGGVAHTRMTLGYDPKRERFIGTWVGSMMTHMWVYEGTLDASEKVLTLETEGPDMQMKGTARYKDIIEIKSDDHRTLVSQVLRDTGEWHEFLLVDYRRK